MEVTSSTAVVLCFLSSRYNKVRKQFKSPSRKIRYYVCAKIFGNDLNFRRFPQELVSLYLSLYSAHSFGFGFGSLQPHTCY